MISVEDVKALMEESSIIEQSIPLWLEENGIEGEAFIYACARLAGVLQEGVAQTAIETIKSGEVVDAGEVLDTAFMAAMGVGVIVGWLLKDRQVGQKWPVGDVVATGVLDTVAARLDQPPEDLYRRATADGRTRAEFYLELNDSDGWVEHYFEELAEHPGMEASYYDKHVGPAIDRIEDWLNPEL